MSRGPFSLFGGWSPQSATVRCSTVKDVTHYVYSLRVVRKKGNTIVKEVPIYVLIRADAACAIDSGFVRLHDAAAASDCPCPPDMLIRPPQALRSLPSPPTTKPTVIQPSN